MQHRSLIVLAVAVATYALGRSGASNVLLALFAIGVAVTLFLHLRGRGDDRFAAAYSVLMGVAAGLLARLLSFVG
jgi:hypothetical protein